MSEPSPERVKELFNRAVELPAAERAAFLESACGADTPLRRRVETLLRSLDEAGSFLASPTQTSFDGRSVTDGTELQAGTTLGTRYRILGLAGKGGMGHVYRADDLVLGQRVALKLLPEELAGDRDRLTRLRDEVRIARQVSHPNVCRVYDIGEAEGRHFLSMEWIDGEDLGSLLREQGQLAPDRASSIARQICAGLAAAHESGVLHRDLKPSNVMIDERGVARITDFGLAELATAVREERVREGTPRYMAPEQLAGEGLTFQSDLYSLGLVLYELFTGQPGYPGGTLDEIKRQRRERPPAPSRLAPHIDPGVEQLILCCLESDPSRRPSSARSLVEALPGGDAVSEALVAAQQRADRIAAFRAELAELQQAGLLRIGREELRTVETHHERVLRELIQRFDVDLTDRAKQLSLGMRAVSLVGAIALAASVYYFFYRIWGTLATVPQVAILVTAPIVALLLTSVVARRERSGYFTLITALVAFSAMVVESSLLGATLNLVSSPVSVLAWGAFALILAYGFRLRLLLLVGLALLSTFLAGLLHQAAGGLWIECFARPETFLPAGLVLLTVALATHRRRYAGFAPVYCVLTIVLLVVPAVLLGMFGALSYLTVDLRTVEISYQLAGFAMSAGAIWSGIASRTKEAVYSGTFFFVTLLFLSFVKWWWNWMPRYLFFLIVAVAAVAVMVALRRLRAKLAATWTEVER